MHSSEWVTKGLCNLAKGQTFIKENRCRKENTEKGRYCAMERERQRERRGAGRNQQKAQVRACEVIGESLVDPTDSDDLS